MPYSELSNCQDMIREFNLKIDPLPATDEQPVEATLADEEAEPVAPNSNSFRPYLLDLKRLRPISKATRRTTARMPPQALPQVKLVIWATV